MCFSIWRSQGAVIGTCDPAPTRSMHPQEDSVKRKLLAAVVLLAVGVGATGYVLFAPTAGAAATTQYLTSTATTGDVTQEAVATGTVAASSTWGLGLRADAALIAVRRHQLRGLVDRHLDGDGRQRRARRPGDQGHGPGHGRQRRCDRSRCSRRRPTLATAQAQLADDQAQAHRGRPGCGRVRADQGPDVARRRQAQPEGDQGLQQPVADPGAERRERCRRPS